MSPLLIASLVSAAIAGSAGFGLAWQLQAHQIVKQELEYANERIAQQRNARATIERAMQQVATSQANAAARGIRNRAAADGAADIAGGLRIKTTDTVRTITDNPAASTDAAAALGAVFDQCVAELTTLGAIADRHASDLQLTQEAWPR